MGASNEVRDHEGMKRVHVYPKGPVPPGETWRSAGTGAAVSFPIPHACHFCAQGTCAPKEEVPGSKVIVHAE